MRRNNTKIRNIRIKKFEAQSGRCFYCQQPMWENDQHRQMLERQVGQRRVAWLRSTAEHLHARCDGGKDDATNLVAACAFCNSRRHKAKTPLTPDAYSRHVRGRLSRGKWHGLVVAAVMAACWR